MLSGKPTLLDTNDAQVSRIENVVKHCHPASAPHAITDDLTGIFGATRQHIGGGASNGVTPDTVVRLKPPTAVAVVAKEPVAGQPVLPATESAAGRA